MTERTENKPIEGSMFLYQEPELLNHEQHGQLGLSRQEEPFAHVRQLRALPVTVGEFATAQKFYPIVFSDAENPVPLMATAVFDEQNLFVDPSGQWESMAYIPAYLRCYPFAFATRTEEQQAVVIDRACPAISDTPEQPFFDGEKVTEFTQGLIDFCSQYDADRRRTRDFSLKLKELGLLTGQQATQTPAGGSEQTIASYVAVDPKKLTELDAATLHELHKEGSLAAIFAHLFSLENWQRLVGRFNQRNSA